MRAFETIVLLLAVGFAVFFLWAFADVIFGINYH